MSKSSVLIFNGGSVGGGGSCNVHNLQLGIMTVNLPGFRTSSMYVLLDRSLPIESAPGYAPADRYALAEWIQRGDVIQVDCADISPETDTSYTGILQSTTSVNQQGELYTNTCTIRLDVKAENRTESRYYRLEIVHDILTDVWYLAQDVNEYTYILNETAENKVQTIDNNSEHYPSCPAVKEAIDTAVASVYHAAGPKTVSQLTSSLLVAANQGNVYNMTDSGTTTADFVEGPGCPIRAGDNVGICDVGDGVYKFDLLSGFVDLSGYLAANGDGSDVTASFTATSARTNISTGEKLSVLFSKIAKWFSDLKALAFKDNVTDSDISGTISDTHIASASTWNGKQNVISADSDSSDMSDATTIATGYSSDKVHLNTASRLWTYIQGKISSVLGLTSSTYGGTSGTARKLPTAYGGFDNQTGYRLLATVSAPSAWSDRISSFSVFELVAGRTNPTGQKGTLTVQIRNNSDSYSYGAYYRGVDSNDFEVVVRSNDDHSVSVYVYCSGGKYGGLQLVLASSSGYTGNPTGLSGLTLYSNNGIQATVTGNAVIIYKAVTPAGNGWIPLASSSGVGSPTQPVYVDENGSVQPCTRKVWRLAIFSNDNHVRDLDTPDINDSTGYSKLKWSDLSSSENRNNDVILLNKSTNKFSSPKITLFRSVTIKGATLIGYADAPTIVGSAFRGVCVCCAVLTQDGQNVELYGGAIDYIGPLYKSFGGSTTSSMDFDNHAVLNLTNDLTAFTINIVTIDSSDSVDVLAEIINNVQCTVTVTINGTTAKYSASSGNTMEANKFYRLRCEGSCWTLEEFV